MRNRLHYPSLAVAVGKGHGFTDAAGDFKNLDRVQSIGFNFEANRFKAGQVGKFGLAANQVLQAPDVNLSVSYLLSDGNNEKNLGFYVNGPNGWYGMFNDMIQNNINRIDDSMDFVVVGVNEGEDAYFKDNYHGDDVIGFGNCYLNSYNLRLGVDSFPTVELGLLGSNMSFQTFNINTGAELPSVNSYLGKPRTEDPNHASYGRFSGASLNPKIVRPFSNGVSVPTFGRGDIRVDIYESLNEDFEKGIGGNSLVSFEKTAIQSVDVSLSMNRKAIRRFGSNYVGDRKIRFPIVSNLNMDVLVRELEVGALKSILTDDKTYNVGIRCYYPKMNLTNPYNNDDIWGYERKTNCDGRHGLVLGMIYKGATLAGQSFNVGIGDNMMSTIQFEVDSAPDDDGFNGIYMYDEERFLRDESAWIISDRGERFFV